MSRSPAYWLVGVNADAAKESPLMDPLRYAGPWGFIRHPEGGTLAFWKGFNGADAPHDPASYRAPVPVADRVQYCGPTEPTTIYDLAQGDRAGVDLTLACGLTITVPCALVGQRRFSLTGASHGRPVSEYGRLAEEVFDVARSPQGLRPDDARLRRLICLAIGQRYRSTPELLDEVLDLAQEDVDPLLSVIWRGDPGFLQRLADAGEPHPSPSSAATASP